MKTYFYHMFSWTVLLPTMLFSETIGDSTIINHTKTDSMITNQIQGTIASDTSTSTVTEGGEVKSLAAETKKNNEDTIDASIIVKKLSKITTSFTTRLSKSRAQGYGGGVIISPMIAAMQMKAVYQLATHDYILKKYTFSELNDDYKPLLVTGAVVYGGVGKGLRIGLGGWGGDYKLRSEPLNDSVLLLNVHQSFGGLLIERAFVKNNFNYLVGGMIGLGSIEVTKTMSDDNAWVKADKENDENATASFAGLSLHSGFTVTLLPWMHVGLDGNSLFMFSVNGFNITGCNGFGSINPGVRLRIVLGNLG